MEVAEILIYEQIGYDWWTGGGITAQSFLRELNALEKDDSVNEILIRINSPGGSISEGIAIYNAIGRCKKTVNTICDGIAWSMGAVILLSGSRIEMANNSTMLLHNGWGGAVGNARDMESYAQMLKAMDTGIANSVADKTGLTVDEVKAKWFDYADHTLTAQEAKDFKLIDEVVSSKADVPKDISSWSKDKVFNYFYAKGEAGKKDGILDQIKGWFKSNTPTNSIPPKPEEPKDENNDDMHIKEFEPIKGLTADKITAEHITALNAKLQAEGFAGIEIATAGTLAALQAKVDEKKPEPAATDKPETPAVDLVALKAQAEGILATIADLEKPAGTTVVKGEDTQITGGKKEFVPVIGK